MFVIHVTNIFSKILNMVSGICGWFEKIWPINFHHETPNNRLELAWTLIWFDKTYFDYTVDKNSKEKKPPNPINPTTARLHNCFTTKSLSSPQSHFHPLGSTLQSQRQRFFIPFVNKAWHRHLRSARLVGWCYAALYSCFAAVVVYCLEYDIFVENVVGIGLWSKDKR